MADAIPDKSSDSTPPSIEQGASRVWQACQACRRKKVKCDGKNPCHNCSSRGHSCEFPEVKDHASVSRQYASSFEARCQQLDSMCQRLETVTSELSRVSEVFNHATLKEGYESLGHDLVQAASVLQSIQGLTAPLQQPVAVPALQTTAVDTTHTRGESDVESVTRGELIADVSDLSSDDSDSDLSNADHHAGPGSEDESDRVGAFVTDSYGRLRFVGGPTNKMLIDAAKALSPAAYAHTPASGGGIQSAETPSDGDVEFPLFVRGQVWPELPYLPRPEQLSRPPQYVSDALVGLYFEKIHYTFPVLFKPHFMQRYRRLLRDGSNSSQAADKEFLLIFFAVCACASGLLPSTPGQRFPGIEYYEKALLLHYASPGQASLESIQCLALLAMCAASWNTLSRSWSLAGQAVRSSMDIGLHLSSKFMMSAVPGSGSGSSMELLKQQTARRIWWSIFSLDRVVSICLGRPMAVHEKDFSCELPLDMSDEQLQRYCSQHRRGGNASHPRPHEDSSPLTGFIAFAHLCHIAGRIQQLGSHLRLRQLSSLSPNTTRKYFSRVSNLDSALRRWLETLPDAIRFSANTVDRSVAGDPGLVMCVIIFIVHAGSLLNLYQCLVRNRNETSLSNETSMVDAAAQCISAARSCINAAELVRDLIPPSHYLAICVHCLTFSGVALLRLSPRPPDLQTIADAERCVGFLKDLESRWSGAGRSRAIVEQLLVSYRDNSAIFEMKDTDIGVSTAQADRGTVSQKRSFIEMEASNDAQMIDEFFRDAFRSDLFAFDAGEIDLFGFQGWQVR